MLSNSCVHIAIAMFSQQSVILIFKHSEDLYNAGAGPFASLLLLLVVQTFISCVAIYNF